MSHILPKDLGDVDPDERFGGFDMSNKSLNDLKEQGWVEARAFVDPGNNMLIMLCQDEYPKGKKHEPYWFNVGVR